MSEFLIRKIEPGDIQGVEDLIKTVMPEFGASGPGFAIHDPEVQDMYEAYNRKNHIYFVVVRGKEVLGGGGIAPLTGSDSSVCELRKMYFKKEIRGKGFGLEVMNKCLESARAFGYKSCYLETLETMTQARKLYEKMGFIPLKGPMGDTGHFSCDRFYLKDLLEI